MSDDEAQYRMSTDTVGSPEGAFSLVANETRMDILLALREADEPLSFSELRERVGMRDSGQFNYHLNKLVGRFVRKEPDVEGDSRSDGYTLRYAGMQVIGSVHSGVYTREVSAGPVPVDSACFECDHGLVARYEDETATVECEACDYQAMRFSIPPSVVEDRDPSRLPSVFDGWLKGQLILMTRGFCPLCAGVMSTDLEPLLDGEDGRVDPLQILSTCHRCGCEFRSPAGVPYLSQSRVVAFHLDHGIDLSTTQLWELEWLFESHTDLDPEDEPPFEVRIDLGDERLVVHVGDAFQVLETDRTTP